ncbi:hypothetical protein PISL3812_07186 [Talaromyces islandicus]|uniref:Uncharacterized protein n=1 Tax=Talaromyces islandicus TaxID=28573 RepID=A0A0U1M3P3_TALIS|nr:hypothetical protein PISL3812_07186 [Talaromyces islandicus]
MLVQQPPVLVIGLLDTILGMQDSHEFYEVHVVNDGLRMGEFFELVLFGEWRRYLGSKNEVAWWGNHEFSKRAWNRMETLRNVTVKFDIALCARGSFSCCLPDPEAEETSREIKRLRNPIDASYLKLDIQPKPLSAQLKTNFWKSFDNCDDWYDDFDFDTFLVNPEDGYY